MKSTKLWLAALTAAFLAAALPVSSQGDDLTVDLAAPSASQQWLLEAPTAQLADGCLVLDGRQQMSRAYFLPYEWADVTVRAKFLVEPQSAGVLACGFMVRAADGRNYYYVHFDRGQAILVRHDADVEWREIKRVGGLDKPAGQWHEGQLECRGNTLRVSLNGRLLYEATDDGLARGRIGFYASQGLARVKDIAVTGERRESPQPFQMPAPNYVLVCADAGAGGYEAFPDVCRLSDGRLMCVFYAGYGHVALPNEQLPRGGRICYCTSSDEGRTWSAAATLFDSPDDDRDPSIVQLRNGTLICNFFSLRKNPDRQPPWDGLGSWLVTSSDLGQTWSAPQRIVEDYYCSAPIRELGDGRLVLGLYAERADTAIGAVTYSDDRGQTWSRPVDIDNGGIRLDAETDVIELRDGTLYAAQRPQMSYATSTDRGQTWTVSQPIGFPGHCPYFLRTRDNIILLAHRVPNTSLHFSVDECRTWSDNVPVDGVGGAYPSMVNLRDGSVLIVYYEEGAGSSIRAKRLRATAAGIEWLPLK